MIALDAGRPLGSPWPRRFSQYSTGCPREGSCMSDAGRRGEAVDPAEPVEPGERMAEMSR